MSNILQKHKIKVEKESDGKRVKRRYRGTVEKEKWERMDAPCSVLTWCESTRGRGEGETFGYPLSL